MAKEGKKTDRATPSPRIRQVGLAVAIILAGWFRIEYSYQHGLVLPPSTLFKVLGAPFLIAGLVLRIMAARELPFTYRIEDLVTTGIYSRTRNPVYLAFLLAIIGAALLSRALLAPAWILVSFILLYGISKLEEKDLERAFGERYLDYKRKVPMMIPRF